MNLEVKTEIKRPLAEFNTRKVVFNEANNENKEIIEREIEYDETGKIIRKDYSRHEIPAKKDTKASGMPVFSVLLASVPSWLILIGIILFGLYKGLKWARREYLSWKGKK